MAPPREPASELQREFGDRIRARRDELGLTQEALAHRADLQRAYIGQLETGMRSVGLDNLGRIAKALEIDLGDLLEGLQEFPGRERKRGTDHPS
jgi:transcriptional regulator with XRE-family HTH domain